MPNERLIGKQELIHIAILGLIALVIGVYLIATTVLIAKDGVFYIERAQQFASDPVNIIKRHPPGYPFLILAAHKCAILFADDSSVFTWIYSAQSVTLLCRLLALIPLYFIGKLLVGSKNSFLALLILIFLPFPTRIVCDVVREWPYLLFHATGFFFLLWITKTGKWWLFGIVGLSSGLGYLIRHESAQLVVYGFLWVAMGLFRPKLWGVSRWKNLFALALLVIGFAVPTVPYMKCTGKIIPPKLNRIMKSFSFDALPDKTDMPKVNSGSSNYFTAKIVPGNAIEAPGAIFKTIGENLMWFFMLPLALGLYYRFRGNAEFAELYLITTFILVSVAMMALRYSIISEHASQRWSLPLVTFTVFYIPVGLQVMGNWLESKFPMNRQKTDIPEDRRLSWFSVLLLIGFGICTPKLFRPVRIEKQGYREAANWLRDNTASTDVIIVPDRRIAFYAMRSTKMMQTGTSTVSGGVITPESWCHLVGTFDGNYQKLYVNGKLVASAEPGFSNLGSSRGDLAIGKPHANHASFFKGLISEVRLYSESLSDEEIEALYDGRISELNNEELVGCWTLEGDASGMNNRPGSAMNFNGTSDYIDLSHLSSHDNADELSVSVWTKPELLNQINWIIGDRGQFRIGNHDSTIYFWIREKLPGHTIPENTAYVVAIAEDGSNEKDLIFSREVRMEYSAWADKRGKKKKIVIFKVL